MCRGGCGCHRASEVVVDPVVAVIVSDGNGGGGGPWTRRNHDV
jgi:hypothetical protein